MPIATLIAATVTAGLLGAGVIVTPAVTAGNRNALDDRGTAACMGRRLSDGPDRDGWGPGRREGFGRGMRMPGAGAMGPGMRPGMGPRSGGAQERLLTELPTGTLTDTQKQTLMRNAEEEKLAHDVYVKLADSSGDVRFTRIAAAELQHLRAVRTVLARYGVEDPTRGKAEGEFATRSVAADYHRYVDAGSQSAEKALEVGRRIERADITVLQQAERGLDAPAVHALYENLQRASQMHLHAFSRG